MIFGQQLRILKDAFSRLDIERELDWVHQRINEVFLKGEIKLDRTLKATGETGSVTMNKIAGVVRLAAGASSIVVTNSFATENSLIFCSVLTNDATAILKNVVAADGSFTIRTTAAVTAETRIAFLITN